jgi:hypothetical protein
MEGFSRRLNTNEIRCPYCRRKQQSVLPYYEDLALEKVNGVNFYDPTCKHNAYHKCEYLYPNVNYDPSQPESNTNTPYLNNTKCHMTGFQIAVYDSQNQLQPINYGDTKHYCYYHQKVMIKIYKNQEKEKIKLANKQAKELAKQTKQLEKQQAKAKAKEEKQQAKAKAKEEKQQAKAKAKMTKNNELLTENVVLGPSNIENQSGCVQILKTGPNKGTPCGCKIFLGNMCKRHKSKN